MKRFITLSLLACISLFTSKTWACADGLGYHEGNFFDVYSHDYELVSGERLARFWAQYTGDRTPLSEDWSKGYRNAWDYYFENNCARLFTAAKKKHDEEMLLYLRQTLKYNKICEELKDSWTYPTAQQLAQRRKTLLAMQRTAKAYGGQRLKAQFALLYMRTNLVLKDYRANQDFWVLTASKLPESVFKDMMHSLYANAILNLGQWRKACDIYVKQGDWESMEWAMRNYRNLAGIKRIYKEEPNSPTLIYLLHYYVNGGYGWEYNYESSLKADQIEPDTKAEAEEFINFVQTDVLHNESVRNKAMWKAAQAMVLFELTNYKAAQKYATEAQQLSGTKRAKDCARCIALLASIHTEPLGEAYSAYVVGEIKWLLGRAAERKPSNDVSRYDYYHATALENVVYNHLIPRYQQANNNNHTLALLGMIDALMGIALQSEPEGHADLPSSWEYKVGLDTLTSKEMLAYYQYLSSSPADPLQRFALEKASKNADFFNSYIGKAYLREGNFAEAIPYLERISLDYVNTCYYVEYVAGTDYTLDRWFTRRSEPSESERNKRLTVNPRLKFCRDMLQLQSQYRLARNKDVQAEVAYTLASHYFQASIHGDCWYLTRDSYSRYDDPKNYEMNFPEQALTLLKQGANSRKVELKLPSLFAMAYVSYAIPTLPRLLGPGSWFEGLENETAINTNYTKLAKYVKSSKTQAVYIIHCDILREFMETKMK